MELDFKNCTGNREFLYRISGNSAEKEYSTRQCPDGIQLDIGHSKRKQGKYNSAYSIGFVVYTCLTCTRRVVTELVSERFPAVQFHSQPPSPPSLYDDMDPAHVDEDRDAVTSFYESHPLIFDGTRRTVSIAVWLYDMELIFRICHIEARLQVSLASRCFAADARLWWMTLGEREMSSRTWAHFRMIVIARYGPVLDEGADAPYRDPEIYRDMYHERYYGFVTGWHAYPQESMGHYCRRFQEAMLPHIPQDIPSPGMQALVILRNGLPPQIRQHTPMPTPDMTVGHMTEYILDAEIIAHAMQADAYVVEPQVPVDDAGMGEPVYEPGPAFPEDPIPAIPVQEIPAQEAGIEVEADDQDDQDAATDMDAPEDPHEDPPIIDISSDDDDEDDDEEPEHEPGYGGWLDEGDEFEDDLEEILYDDGDWDTDSDFDASVITIEYID
ncbi:hypothetical protein TIFTF001_043206 [Ficus carica]|uniref:Uncharacterized protein n=1 Tax=Ficus carica TaxID=3494 RepID=A0AA87ZAC5_FICCA|nr:hypothetical protein TIFTF001_043206 [Ficus carica]